MSDARWDDGGGGESKGSGLPLDLIRDPKGILRRRWLPMTIVAIVGLAATAVAVALTRPLYVAKATVLISSQRVPEEFVRPTVQEDPIERINGLIGSVLSRTSLQELITKRDLYPKLREEEPLDVVIAQLRSDVVIEPENSVARWGAVERAELIGISYTSDDPQVAADVANDIANLFTLEGLKMRSEQARLTTAFMKRELEAAEKALNEHGKRLADFEQEHQGELPTELDSHISRLDRLQQQRQSLAMRITEAETRQAGLRASAPADSPQVQLDALRLQLAQQLAVNKETHPNVQALRRQIALLERAPGGGSGGLGSLAGAIGREVEQLRQQMAETDQQIEMLEAQVAQIPLVGEQYAALERRNKVLQETYLEYLRKVKEAELAESLERAQQGARVAVLDAAVPPTDPQANRLLVALAGVVGSLGLAVLSALALEWRDPVIVSIDGLEAACGARVLGSVPHLG
jgi:uncharacterized protein involved in exopolysaccharide biosynthesis